MTRVSESFSGQWMSAIDVGRSMKAVILEVTEETIGQGSERKTKLVVWFKGKEKGLILNKTNGRVLAELYGDETDDWKDHRVVLMSQKVEYQGKRVDGIRIDEEATRLAIQELSGAPSKKPARPLTQQEADDDVPW